MIIEHYKADTVFNSSAVFEINVNHGNEQDGISLYDFSTVLVINNIPFNTVFGSPDGGYIGNKNLDDLVSEAAVNIKSAELQKYLSSGTPILCADFLVGSKEIKIRRIARHKISAGQGFCERTLRQLLDITPEAKSIFFDFVTNGQLKRLILPVLNREQDISILNDRSHKSVLLSAMMKNGFSQFTLVEQELGGFGIRAYRGEHLSWRMER